MTYYEDYTDRRNTWFDYISIVSLENPFNQKGEHHPEHYLNQYLPLDKPNVELMIEKLSTTTNPREKRFLTLLIREFDTSGVDLEDIVIEIPITDRIKKEK